MSEAGKLTAKQTLFVEWYVKLLNAKRAAERAGYAGNGHTLEQQGSQLLRNSEVKAEIDKRIKASIMSADALLSRVTSTAMMDVTPYLNDDKTLDVRKLAEDGLGHLITGIKPGRNGTEVTLASPQTARKLLAGYHKILGTDVSIDVNSQVNLEPGQLDSLVQQIAAAQANSVEQDSAEDSTA